jgi:hypothetical protein
MNLLLDAALGHADLILGTDVANGERLDAAGSETRTKPQVMGLRGGRDAGI